MPLSKRKALCHSCHQQTTAYKRISRKSTNLFLTLITLGLWLVVWVDTLMCEARLPYKCKYCGNDREIELCERGLRSSWLLWTVWIIGISGGAAFWAMR